MRQILFRGKRIDNGEWVYGGYAQMGDKVFILPVIDLSMAKSFDWVKVIPESVGQFTGLKDIEGNDIWEGDFIRCLNNAIYPVYYADGCFKMKEEPLAYDLSETQVLSLPDGWALVVGNIHDNPELLKP